MIINILMIRIKSVNFKQIRKRGRYLYDIEPLFYLPHHPQLPILLFNNPPRPLLHDPLHDSPLPIKAIPADRENAVVRFQHVVACPDHNGFSQIFRNEAVYLVADFEYFLFVHRHSPFQFCAKKYQPSYLTVGIFYLSSDCLFKFCINNPVFLSICFLQYPFTFSYVSIGFDKSNSP